jgi:lysophospholipid acyltransferase (LPLAT)-like uncharacterized protein
MSNAPLVVLGQSTKAYLEFNTWDRMRIPLPFTKGAMVWGVLPAIPADTDETQMEALRLQSEQALTGVTDRADEILGLNKPSLR